MDLKLMTDEAEIIAMYDKVDLVIDHSREETFNRCQQEAYYAYELGLTRGEANSDALEFGARLHKYLETHDEKVWDGYKEVGKHKRDHRTRAKGIVLGALYQEKYKESDTARFSVVSQEPKFGFVQEDGGKRVLIKGSIDQVLRSKEDETLWVNEFKHSASYNSGDYFMPYYLGHQVRYYLRGVELMYPGEQIGGVIVNLFQVTKAGTDDADLVRKEIAIDDIRMSKHLGLDTAQEWLQNKDRGYWKRNTSACRRFNSICPFYEICRHGERDLVVMATYKEKQHNEWHR